MVIVNLIWFVFVIEMVLMIWFLFVGFIDVIFFVVVIFFLLIMSGNFFLSCWLIFKRVCFIWWWFFLMEKLINGLFLNWVCMVVCLLLLLDFVWLVDWVFRVLCVWLFVVLEGLVMSLLMEMFCVWLVWRNELLEVFFSKWWIRYVIFGINLLYGI